MLKEEALGQRLRDSYHRRPVTKDSAARFAGDIATREDVDKADKKRAQEEYDTTKFADPKNKKYPINDPEHIRAAWNYIHKVHNADEYSPEDAKTIKDRIAAAWRKHISKEGPPEAEEK